MMPKKYITLSAEEQKELENLVRSSPNHRIRQRSQALIWSHQGKDRATIGELYGVRKDTVSALFTKWESSKVNSLADLPRSSRPSKLTAEEKKRDRTL
jgi:transposase